MNLQGEQITNRAYKLGALGQVYSGLKLFSNCKEKFSFVLWDEKVIKRIALTQPSDSKCYFSQQLSYELQESDEFRGRYELL